jgi:DNA-binding transcriptional LysR family regulator
MVSAGMGVTLIPEMAVTVETRSASVSVARFKDPQPARTIGMIWRKTSPLAGQLLQLSQVVCRSADALREQQDGHRAIPGPKRRSGGKYSLKRRAPRQKRSAMNSRLARR